MKPCYTFGGQKGEGYALDWCPTNPGVLATGSQDRIVNVWKPQGGTNTHSWKIENKLQFHSGSVEDIQWNPDPAYGYMLASCSVDKRIAIWDLRKPGAPAMSWVAHDSDVNVIAWSK